MVHATGTGDEIHNIYGHQWAKLVYEGYQKDFPNQRPFILMRAGYAGSQRYGTWGGLQSQSSIALQMGMQGLGFMHSDLGGFAGANLDDELYTRWLQYGVFQPIFRPHAQEEVPSEPVFREPNTKVLAKKAIVLRYQLLPYNYTLAFLNHIYGKPLMRPLFFEEANNKAALTNDKTYLWGHDFLITPVVKAGLKTQEVTFPSKNNWFDFYTDAKIAGGQIKTIIPMIKAIQNTEEYSLKNFDLHFYYDTTIKKSKGKLYNDDGKTPLASENGKYEIIRFKSTLKKHGLNIKITTEFGSKMTPSDKTLNLIVHNIVKKPRKIKSYTFEWNTKTHLLKIKNIIIKSKLKEIKIKL